MDIRQLPAPDFPIQTGPLKFGEAETGVYLCGYKALDYAASLEWLAKQVDDPIQRMTIDGLRRLLLSCDERF